VKECELRLKRKSVVWCCCCCEKEEGEEEEEEEEEGRKVERREGLNAGSFTLRRVHVD
jgi:hypothetical protein